MVYIDEGPSAIVLRGHNLLDEWSNARNVNVQPQVRTVPVTNHARWSKPHVGFVKCSMDASFSADSNKVGIGTCLSDEEGVFFGCQNSQLLTCV